MKKFLTFFSVIAVTVVLTLAISAAAAPRAAVMPAVAVPAASATMNPMPPHPRVHEALEALRNAREHMAHAEGEFHGHRDKAIGHIDAAIHEAEICDREP
jgi:hypothetical protein